ncbi:MAG: DUF3592 domain-containing protein [Bacteroidales bacterium]|nr:DUF3592 domain-containing protein [Bacteroidales bacterium]
MKTYTNSSHKKKFSKSNNSQTIRKISGVLKLKIMFKDVGFMIGMVFFATGTLFLLIFGSMINFNDLKFSKNSPSVEGIITNSEMTNSYVNDNVVYKYTYEYTTKNGATYTGVSYTTNNLHETVSIVYLENKPEISKIQNTTSGAFPVWVIFFILIFPIIGFVLLFSGYKKTTKWIDILKVGKISFGVFHRQESTGASVNDNQVYRMFFKFQVDDQEYEAYGETYRTYELTDEQYEPLVYNPANPDEAIMVDGLPKSVRKILHNEIEIEKGSSMNQKIK